MPPAVWVVTSPAVGMRATVVLPWLVNHSAPTAPAGHPSGGLGRAPGRLMPLPVKVLTAPAVVIRPIVLVSWLVNHSAPSGPAVIPCGWLIRPALCVTAWLTRRPVAAVELAGCRNIVKPTATASHRYR